MTTTVVLSTEWFDTAHRARMHILGGLFFTLGYVSIAALAYGVPQWRFLQLTTSLLAVFFLPYFWLIPESARWLLARRRWPAAAALMEQVARVNGTTDEALGATTTPVSPDPCGEEKGRTNAGYRVSTVSLTPASSSPTIYSLFPPGSLPPTAGAVPTSPSSSASSPSSSAHLAPKPYSIADLFRLPSTRVHAGLLCLLWLIIAVIYYGLSQNPANFGKSVDLHLKHFLFGLIEVPSRLLVLVLLHKCGRRWAHGAALIIVAVSLIVVVVLKFVAGSTETATVSSSSSSSSSFDTAQTVLAIVGKFGASAAFTIVYLRSVEIYPTLVRETGMGVNNVAARVGSLLISVLPVVTGMRKDDFRYMTLGVAVAAVIGVALALALPETRDRKLKDRPEEEEEEEEEEEAKRMKVEGKPEEEEIRRENDAAIIVKEGNLLYLS